MFLDLIQFFHLSGVTNLTSSGNKFFLYYYSYLNYSTTAWDRPEFKASVEITDCKGFFQVRLFTYLFREIAATTTTTTELSSVG